MNRITKSIALIIAILLIISWIVMPYVLSNMIKDNLLIEAKDSESQFDFNYKNVSMDYINMINYFNNLQLKHQSSAIHKSDEIPDIYENEKYMSDNTDYDNIPKYEINLNIKLQKYIWDKCEEYDWEYEIILGLLKLESDFDPNLVCKNSKTSYDIGLAQINNNYLEWYGKELAGHNDFDPYNPYHSIDACFAGLECYHNYWENENIPSSDIVYYTLNSYNMGISGFLSYVKKTGNISRAYDRVIIKNKNQLLNDSKFTE